MPRHTAGLPVFVLVALWLSFAAGVGADETQEQPRQRTQQNRAFSVPRRIPDGVKAIRNLTYAEVGETSLKLDLYLPEKSEDKPPLVVWIHGGGWTQGSKGQVNPVIVRLAAEGYATASIDYRLDGLKSHPVQIHDCKGAIRWLRAHAEEYGYDATRIGVGGGSAGGHLSLLLGLSTGIKELEGTVGGNLDQSSQVHAVVDLFGPSDLGQFARNSERFRYGKAAELLTSASPMTYLTSDDPPVLIFHGSKDPLVPVSQSERLHKAYQDAGLESSLHIIDGAGHGGMQFSDATRRELIKAFFDKHLKPVPQMQGLYWMAGTARMLGRDDAAFDRYCSEFEANLKSNPHLTGVYFHLSWTDLEPQEGKYAFERLDRLVQIVSRADRQYKLAMVPGVNTPEFVYAKGAAKFTTKVSNPYRPNYGEAVSIPLPWDKTYRQSFLRLVETVANRYSSDKHLVAVAVTGANFMSPEMHLPHGKDDRSQWATHADFEQRIEEAWRDNLKRFAAAFPRQQLCIELALPMEGMDDEVARVIDFGIAHCGRRLALQSDQLNGKSDNTQMFTYRTILAYKDRVANGFQTVAGWQYPKTAERQGPIEQTMANYRRAAAEYLEIWHGDGLNVETCGKIVDLLAEKKVASPD